MTAVLSAAPTGQAPTPSPAGRDAQLARDVGAVAGDQPKGRAMQEPASLHLSFEEAETVAADLARVWTGCTGSPSVPKIEQIADLVQRTLRKSRELIDGREVANG